MEKALEELLLEAMGYETIIITCEKCKYWVEVNEKCGYASLCTYNSIGYIEVSGMGYCQKFKRKETGDDT